MPSERARARCGMIKLPQGLLASQKEVGTRKGVVGVRVLPAGDLGEAGGGARVGVDRVPRTLPANQAAFCSKVGYGHTWACFL